MKNLSSILKRKTIKRTFLLSLLLGIYILLSAYSYVNAVSKDLADSVFRLHVIANSDSKEDQDLKYKVRDSLIAYMNTLAKDVSSKEEVISLAQSHIADFQSIAEKTISDNGFDYPVTIKIGNFSFPTKTYGDISFPAGFYDALRVEIGNASGQNWWCVMFPPLCFVDVSSGIVPEDSQNIMKENLTEEEYNLIANGNTNQEDEITFKFKLIEMLENIKILTAKK